jgi:hypothetical protein
MLEQSYRSQGVDSGWLHPDTYVGFSEQAYGVTVLEQCRAHPTLCLVPGDAIWMNSTEGGEIPLLYYLLELNNSIVPKSLCPYISREVNGDHVRVGFDQESFAHPQVDSDRLDDVLNDFGLHHHPDLYIADLLKDVFRKPDVPASILRNLPIGGRIMPRPRRMVNIVYGSCWTDCGSALIVALIMIVQRIVPSQSIH